MIKDMMFCIFYSKNGSYNKEKTIFKSIFPTIMSYIEDEKKDKHNEFAIRLQKIESKICIDVICKELDNENIKYFTIHDAWLVDKNDVDKTTKIIINMFYKNFSRRPEMKIEKIN
jgi:ankyrin repeat protein